MHDPDEAGWDEDEALLDPGVLRQELLSLGVDVPEACIVAWGVEQRMEAYSWVSAVHAAWSALEATEDELLQASPELVLPVCAELDCPACPAWVRAGARSN